jgi:hypothetical protein
MAAIDQFSTVEIPWRPGSKVPVRPMSLRDERMLLADSDDRFALSSLVDRCIDWERAENFSKARDFGQPEMNYLLAKIRLMTYGDEIILSGIECPVCKHKNINHLVYISQLKLLPAKLPLYLTLAKPLPDGRERLKVSKYSIDRQKQISKEIKDHPNDNQLDLQSLTNELSKISLFPELELDEARTLAYEGHLGMMDIHKAIKILRDNQYGYEPTMKMRCHSKKCTVEGGAEIEFEFEVGGPGLLVPSFNVLGSDLEETGDI